MANPYWPLFGLRIRTPVLEVRAPTDDDLPALVELIDAGIHDPSTMPFLTPFTDDPVPVRQRRSLQHWWRCRAEFGPENWSFTGAVFVDGQVVGVQDLMAKDFAAKRSVSTGSWLGLAHQGRGIGKEMRAAVLHLAFAGLGALEAMSGAFADNAASLAVSRALGYEPNGECLELQRGVPARCLELRMSRERWEERRRSDIEITGLQACLAMFGAEATGVG